MSQDPDRPSTGASNDPPEHSVHVRSRSTAHAQSPKRLSVFSGRSRSNTTTSTTSSRRSPASSMTSADAASLPSQEERTAPVPGARTERHESMTKSLFNRGSRILRRQGSKFNIAATLDEEDEAEREKSRFEVFGRHHKSRQSDSHDNLKSLISDPFDFHHLTHTSQSHFQTLDRARETDLVTEFSAIRASQRPVMGLKGIRAEDLHFRDFSSEDLTNCGTAIADDRPDPAPVSPPISPGATSPSSSTARSPRDIKPPRESRVFENFSRPVPRYPRAESTTPPPKTTARLAASPEISEPAPRAIDEILGLSSPPTYPEHVYSHDDDDTGPGSYLSGMNIEAMLPTTNDHAISTGPGKDTAGTTRASSMSFTNLSSDLDDVPEEEEATHWHGSPGSHVEGATSRIQSPSAAFPNGMQPASLARPKSQLSVNVAEELSRKFSEALGSPTLPQYRLGSQGSQDGHAAGETPQRRPSIRPDPICETIYESWDADIDYCYEHAAESNSNFDWARNSVDEPRHGGIGIPITTAEPDSSFEGEGQGVLPSVHLSCTLPTPVLEPSPSGPMGYDGELMVPPRDGEYFQPVGSAILPSPFAKHVTQDTLYEEYLSADAESDRHFSFCSQGVIQPMEHPVSPRSSFSPISKCNSQESLILSRAASIVRKHRSSVSTTSVPELVHSLANSRDLSMGDQLPSGEYSMPSGSPSISGLGRPDSSSHHRQTKSLAREIENQVFYRVDNASRESAELAPSPSPSIHDRAKSTSEVEAAPLVARAAKTELPLKGAQRRKGRTSYSLFPSTPAAN
ncbi:hypothetical protein P170DRAFT_350345 [Aspergillus steynii IBT 23096]|uniref:CRIB domain-containing protein n=1 Tax=Aspergillus steynii IBT 23096 TaxID=1392250 RepID=A0A2I2GG02_9EURO|nr:uncharacterized protein P170DRAFT_350345 [Aspergillus steynii IBT 23096]PLB51809.1 hypothetical protein P170DRAFT_350345 [Aspergillus steynii IBT 23096]